MKNTQIIRDQNSPIEPGFMRNGFFAWPLRKYKCKSCDVIFLSSNGNVHRCQECRPKHEKELQKKWHKKNDKKRKSK